MGPLMKGEQSTNAQDTGTPPALLASGVGAVPLSSLHPGQLSGSVGGLVGGMGAVPLGTSWAPAAQLACRRNSHVQAGIEVQIPGATDRAVVHHLSDDLRWPKTVISVTEAGSNACSISKSSHAVA